MSGFHRRGYERQPEAEATAQIVALIGGVNAGVTHLKRGPLMRLPIRGPDVRQGPNHRMDGTVISAIEPVRVRSEASRHVRFVPTSR